jgi:hypothetical protein
MIAFFVLLTAAVARADPTVIDITYSHRQIPTGSIPDTTIVEASIIARFSATNPIEPAVPDPTMIRVDSSTFQYIFEWNWNGPKAVDFVDDQGETISVVAWPQPVYQFDPALHVMPVMHIHTDSTSLWDPEIGIYVWGNYNNFLQSGEEWERAGTLEYYDVQNNHIFTEEIGIRINGNWSRRNNQKSLRLYFDDYGSSNEVDYDFFGEGPTCFRRLILRTCAYPVYCLNSNILESAFMDLGHLGSRMKPTVLFLNDEYWGFYTLRERWDSKFIEDTHRLADDDYILIRDGEALHGDASGWWTFLDSFAGVADPTCHEWYTGVEQTLDLQTYIDWQILNIFSAARDNGGAQNLVILKIGTGKWRYHMWDQDSAFPYPNVSADFFRFFACGSLAEFNEFYPPSYSDPNYESRRRWFRMLNTLMHNSVFKERFSSRVDELLAGVLSAGAMHDRVDAHVAWQVPELARQFERWTGYGVSGYHTHANRIKQFVTERHQVIGQQKQLFMEHFRVPVELSRFQALVAGGAVSVSWRTEAETGNRGFVLYRSIGTPDQMAAIASYDTHPELVGQLDSDCPTEYMFLDSTAPLEEINYFQLHHVDLDDQVTVHNWIVSAVENGWRMLVINEFMASNSSTVADERGQFEDWVEIYNAGTERVQLGGLFLTDNLANATKWAFPETTLAGGVHLLVWCDDDPDDGPLHATFKLSASGEEIGLYSRLVDGNVMIDRYIFAPQTTDVSEGRQTDGSDTWVFFAEPTPGAANASPLGLPPIAASTPRFGPNYPNPFNPGTRFEFHLPAADRVQLQIYDVRGRLVGTVVDGVLAAGSHTADWDGRDRMGNAAASGTYFARLVVDREPFVRRIMLLK